MIYDINKFEEIIPTAKGSDTSLIKNYADVAEENLKSELLGSDLYDFLATKKTNRSYSDIITLLHRCIFTDAYQMAIPNVDLIQTDNGFAIINNSNQAPASKDRVDKLLQSVKVTNGIFTDMLINKIIATTELHDKWKNTDQAKDICKNIFITGMKLSKYYGSTANRVLMTENMTKILGFQDMQISEFISPEYMSELLEKQRLKTLNAYDNKIIPYMCSAISNYLHELDKHAVNTLENAVNIMVKSIDSYSTYKDSDTYALKTSEKLTNTADSSVFFGA